MNRQERLEKAAQAYEHAARVQREAQEYIKEMTELGMEVEEVEATFPYERYRDAAACWTLAGNAYREEAAAYQATDEDIKRWKGETQ